MYCENPDENQSFQPLRAIGTEKRVYYSNFRIIQNFLWRMNVLPFSITVSD